MRTTPGIMLPTAWVAANTFGGRQRARKSSDVSGSRQMRHVGCAPLLLRLIRTPPPPLLLPRSRLRNTPTPAALGLPLLPGLCWPPDTPALGEHVGASLGVPASRTVPPGVPPSGAVAPSSPPACSLANAAASTIPEGNSAPQRGLTAALISPPDCCPGEPWRTLAVTPASAAYSSL